MTEPEAVDEGFDPCPCDDCQEVAAYWPERKETRAELQAMAAYRVRHPEAGELAVANERRVCA